MTSSYPQFSRILCSENPPECVFENVVERIARTRLIRARTEMAVYSTVTIAAVVALVPIIGSLSNQVSQSGFSEYVSLVISDSGYALENWRQMTLTLLESMPVMGTVISVGVILIFVTSLRYSLRSISSLSSYRLHTNHVIS